MSNLVETFENTCNGEKEEKREMQQIRKEGEK